MGTLLFICCAAGLALWRVAAWMGRRRRRHVAIRDLAARHLADPKWYTLLLERERRRRTVLVAATTFALAAACWSPILAVLSVFAAHLLASATLGRRVSVLWLRKFGPRSGLDSEILRGLGQGAIAITLVDERIRVSRAAPVGAAAMGAVALAAAIVYFARIPASELTIRTLGLCLVAAILLVSTLADRRSVREVDRLEDVEPVVARALRDAKPRWTWPWTSGVLSIRTSHDLWPVVVAHLAQRVDAVVVDATRGGQGVSWELGVLAEIGRAEDAIILTESGDAAAFPSVISSTPHLLQAAILERANRTPPVHRSAHVLTPTPPAPAESARPREGGPTSEGARRLVDLFDRITANPTPWGGGTSLLLVYAVPSLLLWQYTFGHRYTVSDGADGLAIVVASVVDGGAAAYVFGVAGDVAKAGSGMPLHVPFVSLVLVACRLVLPVVAVTLFYAPWEDGLAGGAIVSVVSAGLLIRDLPITYLANAMPTSLPFSLWMFLSLSSRRGRRG